MASSTGAARSNERVWAVAGDVAEQLAQRGGAGVNGAVLATSCPRAFWSVPAHALSCVCTSGRPWALRVPTRALHHWLEHCVWHAQWSERNPMDKVVHAEKGQREGGHGAVHAMPRHGKVLVNW
jgi:hypothetical protein